MNEVVFNKMHKGERFFIVDLTSVSLFDSNSLKNIAQNKIRYKQIPFLYLISSYIRNSTISIASNRLNFVTKKQAYSWMIYEFQY